jgi:hypothetical protein
MRKVNDLQHWSGCTPLHEVERRLTARASAYLGELGVGEDDGVGAHAAGDLGALAQGGEVGGGEAPGGEAGDAGGGRPALQPRDAVGGAGVAGAGDERGDLVEAGDATGGRRRGR